MADDPQVKRIDPPLVATWERIQPSVVAIARMKQLENGEPQFVAFGTGVCIHEDGFIVTARHVIEEEIRRHKLHKSEGSPDNLYYADLSEDIYVVFITYPTPETFELHFSTPMFCEGPLDQGPDIIFIKIPKLPPNEPKYPFIKLCSHETILRPGQPVASAGFPLMTKEYNTLVPFLFQGIVSVVFGDLIACDINLHRGNSGGPIFSIENGQLIGIATKYRTAGVITHAEDGTKVQVGVPTNIVYIVPFNVIQIWLDKFTRKELFRGGESMIHVRTKEYLKELTDRPNKENPA
jgi:S1-C subfamily serine protease